MQNRRVFHSCLWALRWAEANLVGHCGGGLNRLLGGTNSKFLAILRQNLGQGSLGKQLTRVIAPYSSTSEPGIFSKEMDSYSLDFGCSIRTPGPTWMLATLSFSLIF